jgi:hypothetical protein
MSKFAGLVVISSAAAFLGSGGYVLIPTGVPVGAREVVDPKCDIKGNISIETGERIYHVPGQKRADEDFTGIRRAMVLFRGRCASCGLAKVKALAGYANGEFASSFSERVLAAPVTLVLQDLGPGSLGLILHFENIDPSQVKQIVNLLRGILQIAASYMDDRCRRLAGR